METDTVQVAFLDALDQLDVAWTRTSGEGLAVALREVVVPPAVGAPLPFDGVSLDGSGVNLDPTPPDLERAKTGVTGARLAVAPYGTVVLESRPDATEAASLFPDMHIVIVQASDIVPDMTSAFRWFSEALRERQTTVVLATGPSATADMGALVRGAHGPKRVHVILLDDQ